MGTPWSRVRVMVLTDCRVMVGICRVIVCRWDDVASFIIPGCTVMVILYSCSIVRVSHGLGLGLGFSHIVELWFWHLQHSSLSLG